MRARSLTFENQAWPGSAIVGDVLADRHIPVQWLERALREPELKQPNPTDAALERRYRKIPEHGNRVLPVVVNATVAPERVVSVYFDRAMKGKL